MLPNGVLVRSLEPRPDVRGSLVELYRDEWETGFLPVQWNVLHSKQGVLRGVQVHLVHVDSITVVAGSMVLGLHDMRPSSPTFGLASTLLMSGQEPSFVVIPVGVAHGFYFREPSITVHGRTHHWDPADEIGCRWDDPELGIDWTCSDPIVNERDGAAGTVSEMRRLVALATSSAPV